MAASVLGGEVSDTQQTPEKSDVYTPTADPNAAVSVPEESADSVIAEEPAESVPEEIPASEGTDPPAEAPADTAPTPEAPPAESEAGAETEAPSISLPTQEEVEQAASSLHQAASTVLDALFGSGTGSGE